MAFSVVKTNPRTGEKEILKCRYSNSGDAATRANGEARAEFNAIMEELAKEMEAGNVITSQDVNDFITARTHEYHWCWTEKR